jgi:hypothetical protein
MTTITTEEKVQRTEKAPAADQFGLPWDISELAPRKLLLEWIDKQLETIDWANPAVNAFEAKHPEFRPKMFLRLLTYAYATGTFASEDVVEGCYTDATLRSICENEPPTVRAIILFRRENRGLLQWVMMELLKQAIRYHLNAGDFLVSPGLKRYLADAAVSRIDIARHMDRGARNE